MNGKFPSLNASESRTIVWSGHLLKEREKSRESVGETCKHGAIPRNSLAGDPPATMSQPLGRWQLNSPSMVRWNHTEDLSTACARGEAAHLQGQGSGGEYQPVLWLTFTSRSKGVRWGLVAQPYLGGTIHILCIRASIPPGSLPAPALVPSLPSPQPEQMKPLTQTNYYPEPLPSFFLMGFYFLFGGFCAVKQVHRPFVSGMAMRFWLRCAWRWAEYTRVLLLHTFLEESQKRGKKGNLPETCWKPSAHTQVVHQ